MSDRLPTLKEATEKMLLSESGTSPTDFDFVWSAYSQFRAAADVLRDNLKQFHAARGIEEPNVDSISLSDLAKLVGRYSAIRK